MTEVSQGEINPLESEGCRNIFDLGDYQLYNYNYHCVLYKQKCCTRRCGTCMFTVSQWKKPVVLLIIWWMLAAMSGNRFNFLSLYPFPKFKIKYEISVDACWKYEQCPFPLWAWLPLSIALQVSPSIRQKHHCGGIQGTADESNIDVFLLPAVKWKQITLIFFFNGNSTYPEVGERRNDMLFSLACCLSF